MFFADPSCIKEDQITITGQDVKHIKNVLRMRTGERIEISDQEKYTYVCEILSFDQDTVHTKIIEKREESSELSSKIYLFQSLPKGDKMEWIVQKAVELGVYKIIPVSTARTIVKLDAKKEKSKVKRWSTVAESAAKQSGRIMIPRVEGIFTFKQALALAGELDISFIPYELERGMTETRRLIGNVKRGQSVGIFIGPEGGFEETEVEQARGMQVKPLSLGKRILRTETAGLAMLSVLMYHLEEE